MAMLFVMEANLRDLTIGAKLRQQRRIPCRKHEVLDDSEELERVAGIEPA